MFGKRDHDHPDRIESLLGKGTEFRGTLVSSGVVRIDGRLEGEINHNGTLVIGESAVIVANVKAKQLTIAGHVKGNVDCDGRLELVSTARLYGDIKVGQLVVADGAIFHGVSMTRGNEQPAPAKLPSAKMA